LLGYGSWNAIGALARLSRTQFGTLLLGTLLGLATVPIFAVAARLLSAVGAALTATTGVLVPLATTFHAKNETDDQRRLFLVGGRNGAALGVFLAAYLLALGDAIIARWVGSSAAAAGTVLTILVLGELLTCTQYVTHGIIMATARHRALAAFALSEAVGVCLLTVALVPLFGLIGAAVAIAIPAFLARGIGPLIHGCRIVKVPVRQYALHALLPPFLCAVPPVVLLRLLNSVRPSESWGSFLAYSAMYATLYGVCFACFLRLSRPTAAPREIGGPQAPEAPTAEEIVRSAEPVE
jgi:O-antigen/teichoic acid export membrane protein